MRKVNIDESRKHHHFLSLKHSSSSKVSPEEEEVPMVAIVTPFIFDILLCESLNTLTTYFDTYSWLPPHPNRAGRCPRSAGGQSTIISPGSAQLKIGIRWKICCSERFDWLITFHPHNCDGCYWPGVTWHTRAEQQVLTIAIEG